MRECAPAVAETMYSAILFEENLTVLAIDRAGQSQQERACSTDGVGGTTGTRTIARIVARKTQPQPSGDG